MKESVTKRMDAIVCQSYNLLCKKIVDGNLSIGNEGTLQLMFGLMLSDVARLYQYGANDHFTITMEKEVENINTWKSKGDARIDIFLTFFDGVDTCRAAIELKFLPKDKNEAVTDNRFYILGDIENLEAYRQLVPANLGYLLVFTTNISYTQDGNSYVPLGNGEKPVTGDIVSRDRETEIRIHLDGRYKLQWDKYDGERYFLLLKV